MCILINTYAGGSTFWYASIWFYDSWWFLAVLTELDYSKLHHHHHPSPPLNVQYLCSSVLMMPLPLLCLPLIIIVFIFISVMEGSRRGTATQNSASWGGNGAPEGVFFFCPCRNFSLPWNCMVWRTQREEEEEGHELRVQKHEFCIILRLCHHTLYCKSDNP